MKVVVFFLLATWMKLERVTSEGEHCFYVDALCELGCKCWGYYPLTAVCHCPHSHQIGHWSSWSAFSTCSVSCGTGQKSRHRSCSRNRCAGNSVETISCQNNACPSTNNTVNGGWTSWGKFTPCDKSCGKGMKLRQRQCTISKPSAGGTYCVGNSFEVQPCNNGPCQGLKTNGGWSTWGQFTPCDKSCDTGLKIRNRQCNNPSPSNGGTYCIGNSLEVQSCTNGPCQSAKVNGSWSSWGHFTKCDKNCGGGTQIRYRNCTNPTPANGGTPCIGNSLETASCNTAPCKFVTLSIG